MTYDDVERHSRPQTPTATDAGDTKPGRRAHSNRVMLDLRQQVAWQGQVICALQAERDRLTRELASRLVFVEGQLRREQKNIEALLDEKDHFIRFQALQIRYLKSLLSPAADGQHGWDQHRHYSGCPTVSGRSSASCPMSRRYSVALMRNGGVVSHASPVMVRPDSARCRPKTLSLPELREDSVPPYENVDWVSRQVSCYSSSSSVRGSLSRSSCWATSDCDSEHSDSLDSGISSPSVSVRRATVSMNSPVARYNTVAERPKRSPSLDGFITRALSLSCKSKSNAELSSADDHGFLRTPSVGKARDRLYHAVEQKVPEKQNLELKKANRFPSSANRNFGTNHRSVTKPRDIKFKKLFKFRRRSDPTGSEGFANDNYMTV